MPPQLSLAEVRQKILNENITLPQLSSYVRMLLPTYDPGTMNVISQGLWNTKNGSGTEAEFDAQWRMLTDRLRNEYDLIDDLEKRAQRTAAEGARMRINLFKEENQQQRTRNELLEEQERIQRELDEGPVGTRSITQPPEIPLRTRAPPIVSGEELEMAAKGAQNAAKAGAAAAVKAGQLAGAGAKAVGNEMWAGLKLGGRGVKAVGGAVGNAMDTPVSEENLILWTFFFFTLGLHALIVYVGMQLQWFIYAIGAILLGVIWWMFRGFNTEELKIGIIVSFIAGIPYILATLSNAFLSNPDYINGVSFLAMIIPVWPVFLLAKLSNHSKVAYGLFWIYRVALVALVLIFVVWPILGSTLGALPPIGDRVDVGGATTGFWDLLTERWNRVTNRVASIGQYYTNPDYYTGRVDENKGKPLGVTISDLRPVDPEISNDSQMILFANVETKSFVGEQTQIVPACVIERSDVPATSNVEPNVLDIVYGTTGSFECTFDPPVGDWRRGVYGVKASATFPFQTWGYLPYTFVDEELARNIARQGLEVRLELDIDQNPTAVYTSGPIVLGMGGTDQPILVRREDAVNNYLAPGSRVGVTLDGGWQDGELTAVHQIQLKVPDGFILTGCDRQITSTAVDPNAPGYTSYVFENPADTSIAVDYTTITCKLGLASATAATNLVAAGDKAERTFVAVAIYDYTTEKKTSVRVR